VGQQPLHSTALVTLHALCVLVPLNYALIALMQERGFTRFSLAPVGVFLFVQAVVVAVLWRSAESNSIAAHNARLSSTLLALPGYGIFAVVAAGVVVLTRFLHTKKATESAMLWSLISFYLCLRNAGSGTISEFYLATGAYILAFSIVENSYLLAYHDELTSLPSRRAFNEATPRLHQPYSLAVVDIDHFKRFNDTYGHDVGDQVLRLVAAKLAGVTGGGQAYRCGGEEFTIVFPGKTVSEVTEHLQTLRLAVENAEFRMRGQDRRQQTRGPDRRNTTRVAHRKKKGDVIRALQEPAKNDRLSVTVSIGAAGCPSDGSNPEIVLEAADKALYRAKENGRNRLEISRSARSKLARAAGIA
jgi:diguanylate cyclase (GGDEF)-like protein